MAVNGGLLRGIAEVVGGTVLGGLLLRLLGIAALDTRLHNIEVVAEERHQEIIRRLERLETIQMEREQ